MSPQQRWYPSKQQLGTPEATERSFRQLLEQHYNLQDQVAAMREEMAKPKTTAPTTGSATAPPPGCGPADTQLLGLRVVPVDTQSLANGATLKFNKAGNNFQFS
jgi:hypothetical protein